MKINEIIFIHIPKTAGTSLIAALDAVCLKQRIKFNHDNTHRTPQEWIAILGKERFKNALKIQCMRNPFDRAISCYEHGKRHNRYKDDNFESWSSKIDFYRKAMPEIVELKEQINWFIDQIYGEVYYICFEYIKRDWESLLKRLNNEYFDLPKLNKGIYNPENCYYNKSGLIMNKISKAFENDFHYWYKIYNGYNILPKNERG